MGHEVIVANPRKVKLITQSVKKNDRMDAEQLARLARVDPKLLSPIQHRGAEAQADLAVVRGRMRRKERVERKNGADGRIAQHQSIQQVLAQIPQPLAQPRLVSAKRSVVDGRTKKDARKRFAVGPQSERQGQAEQVKRQKEADIGAALPQIATHDPPARERRQ